MTGKEVLRAIADGADPSEFEHLAFGTKECWTTLDGFESVKALAKCVEQFRRKPRTRVVNGFTVPAPIQEMPEKGSIYFVSFSEDRDWCRSFQWDGGETDHRWLSRGLLFSTKEAAIANAKAMVGVDPEGEA